MSYTLDCLLTFFRLSRLNSSQLNSTRIVYLHSDAFSLDNWREQWFWAIARSRSQLSRHRLSSHVIWHPTAHELIWAKRKIIFMPALSLPVNIQPSNQIDVKRSFRLEASSSPTFLSPPRSMSRPVLYYHPLRYVSFTSLLLPRNNVAHINNIKFTISYNLLLCFEFPFVALQLAVPLWLRARLAWILS